MADGADRAIGVAAGLLGAAGVAISAVGAHAVPTANLDTAGAMAIVHAAALLALSAPGSAATGGRRAAALVILAGTCLFSGDLAARAFLGHGLFPMAAPAGGLGMIAGWVLVGLAHLAGRR